MTTQQMSAAHDYAALDDAALVRCVQAGERGAFRQIMKRCNQRMFRMVRGVLQNDSEAEDVVQEAYVHAFENINGFRGDASLATWLTRIALNEAYGRLRRRRETMTIDRFETSEAASDNVLSFPNRSGGDDPADVAARAQLRHLLERAVDGLPEAFRMVYLLREIEGCTVQETATTLGLRVETVKTRLHRARRLLRNAINDSVGAAGGDAFPFLGARCERMTGAVMARISRHPGPA